MPGQTSSSSSISNLSMHPQPTVEHINNCSFSSWHSKYKRLCPKTRIIKPLPRTFIEYLLADGIRLPKDDVGLTWDRSGEDSDSDDNDDDDDDDDDDLEDPTDKFEDLHKQISTTIHDLGGSVCPKLNWSAPKDAIWISTTNDLKCVNPSDLYMLLKASSYITHDLTESYDECVDKKGNEENSSGEETETSFELVLRKWFDINPALEFRCFVKDRHIVGITQRDMNYYDFLAPLKDKLEDEIHAFFEENLEFTFPDSSFAFDVYIPAPYNRVWLIDINPWAKKTDTLLYSWKQLLEYDPLHEDFDCEFRLVERMDSSRGFGTVEHSESYVPKDFVESGLDSSSMAEMVNRLREVMNTEEDSSDEE